jgi:hypothetical protein
MKYVMLFCGTAEDAAAFETLSPDELGERYAEVGELERVLADTGPDQVGSVRLDEQGTLVIPPRPRTCRPRRPR